MRTHAHVLLGGGYLDSAYVDYGLGNFAFYDHLATENASRLARHLRATGRRHGRPARGDPAAGPLIVDDLPQPLSSDRRRLRPGDVRPGAGLHQRLGGTGHPVASCADRDAAGAGRRGADAEPAARASAAAGPSAGARGRAARQGPMTPPTARTFHVHGVDLAWSERGSSPRGRRRSCSVTATRAPPTISRSRSTPWPPTGGWSRSTTVGTGTRPRPATLDGYTIEQLSADLAALLEAVGAGRSTCSGTPWAGGWSWAWCWPGPTWCAR